MSNIFRKPLWDPRKKALIMLVFRSNQVFRLWVGSPNPVWFQERSLHCQRVSWGKQTARYAGWIHSQVCSVSRVWQSWDWFGKYAKVCLLGMAVEKVFFEIIFYLFLFFIWLKSFCFPLHGWTLVPSVFVPVFCQFAHVACSQHVASEGFYVPMWVKMLFKRADVTPKLFGSFFWSLVPVSKSVSRNSNWVDVTDRGHHSNRHNRSDLTV